MSTHELCKQWLELSDDNLTVDSVNNILRNISQEEWVTAAVANKLVDDVNVQRALLTVGIEKTVHAVERSRLALTVESSVEEESDIIRRQRLAVHFTTHPTDELLCRLRLLLLQRLDKLETYVEMFIKVQQNNNSDNEDDQIDGWDDLDAWEGEAGTENNNTSSTFTLATFLRQPLLTSALLLGFHSHFTQLSTLLKRHAKILSSHRLAILDCIPDHVHPSQFQNLLPTIDFAKETESDLPDEPWRPSLDWTETDECISALINPPFTEKVPVSNKRSTLQITDWYRKRIRQVDDSGLADIALALVQHGASLGIPELDELGEDLSLLCRLVYNAPKSVDSIDDDEWTLSRWKALNPPQVLRAYLAYSTPETIPNDIKHLVMPYLYVLEARAERLGQPDPTIVNRLLYEYILQSPLEFVAVIFSASKPILPLSERIIKSDEDLVRLALACLYGNGSLDEWTTMSRIFECLPEWSNINEEDEDEADTTLTSLGDFVAPNVSGKALTPQDLFIFFTPLTASALSHLLDVLDVHLESGEILSRWDVPAPLRWFLQSANDKKEQQSWATRMSRRAGAGGGEPETEAEWLELLEDMLKLIGSGKGSLRGAFGLLSKEEISSIFFSGLLGSGNFRVARDIIRKAKIPYLSDPHLVEEKVLACSRELYDNASSGNLHQGDMKLAYECLSVARPSPAIQREREFIEATSRICSFNVTSRPGIPISPIEIRLEKDKLSLIARILSSTEDAYKHSGVILELVYKLGYQDDIAAGVRVRAMLAEAALQAEDFSSAVETINQMIDIVSQFPKDDKTAPLETSRELCWRSCFQLGRQTEYENSGNKLRLLGYALELCPPEHMLTILNVWQRTEGESLTERRKKLTASTQATTSRKHRMFPSESSTAASIRSRLHELSLGATAGIASPDATAAAALASRALKGVAANFPFSMRGRQGVDFPNEYGNEQHYSQHQHQHTLAGADVSAHAKQAFARGIGWLIGTDEE
ncbi:hypothetical protein Clacol_002960 [Clathrus columnatus]|uniref:Sec39 domain-containing protein n=1 Tax=Clathrus columnatus TaxID=1419009 RepID=A0AAV5A6V6_9AGAM|nr:hypothetical protein Clacol_002960 [Clathrus columnatus]